MQVSRKLKIKNSVSERSDSIEKLIILRAVKAKLKSEQDLNALGRIFLLNNKNKGMPPKSELLRAYHELVDGKRVEPNKNLEKLLIKRRIRTLSGVTVITSLVKPFPCPGKCVYCPLDVRMPKSYLASEPAAARALALSFSPFEQMKKRIEALEKNGHPTEKIELIIKGGTWNSYPLSYQYWFILESFRAANDIKKPKATKLNENSPADELKKELFKEQKMNEKSKHRIIGLTLETRPDSISEKTLWQMREMGCTRLEIGVQHTSDDVLRLIKRGHTAEQIKNAAMLARNFGFKTDFHLMPQLPGSTPKKDLAMLKEIFDNPGYRPDMIKIYPCTVIKGSELYDWFKEGKYKAYPVKKLIEVLKEFKSIVPRYTRISRLIRDVPGDEIENGNVITNLRQTIQKEMERDGTKCNCLRCREAGHQMNTNLKPKLFIDKYETNGGTEYFLSFEDSSRRIVFAFCRLRIVSSSPAIFPAFIRELHTYGELVKIGTKEKSSVQHKGLGKKLICEAEKIARRNKARKLAVISGVGVRDYYRSLGYKLEKTYLVKNLA